jgi:hypothetical protein
MFYGVLYTVLTLAVAWIANWRRVLLMSIFSFAAVCALVVDLVLQPLVIMMAFILMQGTALGIGSVASYFVDLYPTAYR